MDYYDEESWYILDKLLQNKFVCLPLIKEWEHFYLHKLSSLLDKFAKNRNRVVQAMMDKNHRWKEKGFWVPNFLQENS